MGSTVPEPGDAVMVVRLRQGTVGETRRVCHVVRVPDTAPGELVALCGERIGPGQAELLTAITGMPCEVCLMMSARSAPGGLLPVAR
ncbi:hypothetical protein ABZ863_26120 [Saccharomonospora sp. NPDC046836]|uniref:hypothetical protein n=1 Tax=Saccharomonospora sp. NPDC046836 TaxID=3156921 RepID=UPI003403E815